MRSAPIPRPICVCVPARNEAERLPRLLRALAAQDWPDVLPVVIALNNTTDGSRETVERLARDLVGTLAIHVDERTFPPESAHAGSARRRAAEIGMEILGGDERGVLLTTDADARPPADWARRNVEAIGRGVDLVGGALVLDDEEPVSPHVRSRWDALAAYWRAVRAIEDAIDPVPWDSPPRHGDHTGASLAATVEACRAVGGFPAVPLGEDAAFATAARTKGFRLAHPADVWTRVSARIEARAVGGMAATMRGLAQGEAAAMSVPSLEQWRSRAVWRRGIRLSGGDPAVATLESELPPITCDVVVAPPSPEVAA
ncbi:MAG: glycosyl transferase family 2 [Ancylobacter novellus]|uniref:Glycosyl transferase family 2 n=1 Tax=Ancylobacter novellus TaxID=921 RepID=A0A2W5K5B7_ANCNO|nr:MAG: glycosyl transferase family 2 [Ancylobacter novellus]